MCIVFHSTQAQVNLLTDIPNRNAISLDGNIWVILMKLAFMIIAIKRWLKIVHQPIGITISQKIKLARPEEIAGIAWFLAGPDATYL